MASLKEEIFHTHTDSDAPLAFIVNFCHAKTCCTKSAKGIAHTQYDCRTNTSYVLKTYIPFHSVVPGAARSVMRHAKKKKKECMWGTRPLMHRVYKLQGQGVLPW